MAQLPVSLPNHCGMSPLFHQVREMAGTTLSGLLHCGVFSIEPKLQSHFEDLCKTRLPSKKVRLQNNFNNDGESERNVLARLAHWNNQQY